MSPPRKKDSGSDAAQRRQLDLAKDWETARSVFRAFQTVAPEQRFHHLGLLFEHLSPWIERGVRAVMLRYFLILPAELALARLFARAARRGGLPETHEAFQLWIESCILRDLTDPSDELGAINGAAGEPSGELQRRFNALPFRDRALLYLYMVEKNSVIQVAEQMGMPAAEVAAALNRIWRGIAASDPKIQLPLGWRAPENLLGESS